jgi:hypothetical protein
MSDNKSKWYRPSSEPAAWETTTPSKKPVYELASSKFIEDLVKVFTSAAETPTPSAMGFPYQPFGMGTKKEFPVTQQFGERIGIPRQEMQITREAFTEEKEAVKQYQKYVEEYKKQEKLYLEQQEKLKETLTNMYEYAIKNRLPAYEPAVSQVNLGMPFGVPINVAPMVMAQLTKNEQERQQLEQWQQKLIPQFEPETLGTLPTEITGMPAQFQEALNKDKLIKEAKSKEEKIAKSLMFQRVGIVVEEAKKMNEDPNIVILRLMATDPSTLEEVFGYPITPKDIADAYQLYTKTLLGEYGE